MFSLTRSRSFHFSAAVAGSRLVRRGSRLTLSPQGSSHGVPLCPSSPHRLVSVGGGGTFLASRSLLLRRWMSLTIREPLSLLIGLPNTGGGGGYDPSRQAFSTTSHSLSGDRMTSGGVGLSPADLRSPKVSSLKSPGAAPFQSDGETQSPPFYYAQQGGATHSPPPPPNPDSFSSSSLSSFHQEEERSNASATFSRSQSIRELRQTLQERGRSPPSNPETSLSSSSLNESDPSRHRFQSSSPCGNTTPRRAEDFTEAAQRHAWNPGHYPHQQRPLSTNVSATRDPTRSSGCPQENRRSSAPGTTRSAAANAGSTLETELRLTLLLSQSRFQQEQEEALERGEALWDALSDPTVAIPQPSRVGMSLKLTSSLRRCALHRGDRERGERWTERFQQRMQRTSWEDFDGAAATQQWSSSSSVREGSSSSTEPAGDASATTTYLDRYAAGFQRHFPNGSSFSEEEEDDDEAFRTCGGGVGCQGGRSSPRHHGKEKGSTATSTAPPKQTPMQAFKKSLWLEHPQLRWGKLKGKPAPGPRYTG